MPAESTPEDIAEAYRWGWQLGLKALAIYRDGSKRSQPLSTKAEGKAEAGQIQLKGRPYRERLPDTRRSLTHKFNVSGHEGYITVGLYDDGRPGELFITMAKEGSTVGGLMDSFGTAVSMSLQYGVPLKVLVDKFSHTRFDPMGHTTNPDIRIAKSVVDYIFRWLGMAFLSEEEKTQRGLLNRSAEEDATPAASLEEDSPALSAQNGANGAAIATVPRTNGHVVGEKGPAATRRDTEKNSLNARGEQFARFQSDAPSCDNCGAITVRNGNCYLCHNCGNSMGCS
jgi:ribonucleoside-diphosphate reductase alpha chain